MSMSAPVSAPPQTAFHHQPQHQHQHQQQQQQKDLTSASLPYTSHHGHGHGHQLAQNHSIPPTPTSAELQHGLGTTQRYEHQQFMPHSATEDVAAFTPLISPDMTPLEHQFRMMPEYSLPSQYFTPLTSPAIEAMNMPQSMLQSLAQGYDASSAAVTKQSSQDQMYVFQGNSHQQTTLQGQQQQQQQQQQQHFTTPSTVSPAIIPGAMESDVSMGNAITSEPTSASVPAPTFHPRSQSHQQQAYPKNKGRASMRAAAGMNRARQSPSILAQKRKVGEPEQQPDTIPEQTESQSQDIEPLMPPPALPGPSRRTSIVNDIASNGQGMAGADTAAAAAAAAAAATPATLMKLARRRSSNLSGDMMGTSQQTQTTTPEIRFQQAGQAVVTQPMEDLQLPRKAISTTSCTMQPQPAVTSSAILNSNALTSPCPFGSESGSYDNSANTSPLTTRNPKSRPFDNSLQGSGSPVGDASAAAAPKGVRRASSGNSLRKSGSSASPSIAPKRKQSARSLSVLTPKIAPTPGSGAGPSPAIRPKLSPCIPANGGGVGGGVGGAPGGGVGPSPSTQYDLASKSNYQRILDGTLLPGVSYPETLTENLSSKRKNHKLAEQGRRNRINAALKEMEALIPVDFAREFSQKKKAKEKKEEEEAAAAESPVSAGGSTATATATAKANQAISKASTVEMAIVYIKALQEELQAVKQQQQQQQQQREQGS
ncbi:alpha-1,6-mannosyltransferase [Ascosphaera pollenicola]|nr:alpha-1,6-mannosyltransferase [Ascosphaera pollenicola]